MIVSKFALIRSTEACLKSEGVGDIGDDEEVPIDARQTTGDRREYKCEDTNSSSSKTPVLVMFD